MMKVEKIYRKEIEKEEAFSKGVLKDGLWNVEFIDNKRPDVWLCIESYNRINSFINDPSISLRVVGEDYYECDRCKNCSSEKMEGIVFPRMQWSADICDRCRDGILASFKDEKSEKADSITEFESEYLLGVAYDSNQDKEAILEKYYNKGKYLVQYNSDTINHEWVVVISKNDFGALINHLNISLRIVEKS